MLYITYIIQYSEKLVQTLCTRSIFPFIIAVLNILVIHDIFHHTSYSTTDFILCISVSLNKFSTAPNL